MVVSVYCLTDLMQAKVHASLLCAPNPRVTRSPSRDAFLLRVLQMLLFPGQPPSQSGRYSVSMGGELTIADVHPEDSGFYICQAISVAGSVLTKALLEVEGGGTQKVVLTLWKCG